MYCLCITILGYTSHSRKFEKLINICLNKKLWEEVQSITDFKKQPLEVFYKKAFVKNLAIFTTRKHLWWSLFLIKLQTLRPVALLKIRVQHCEYCKIFKNIYFEDHLETAASASWSIFYKEFVDINYKNASFGILEDSICTQLIDMLTTIAFWSMKYLFRILCVVFIAHTSHYGKFTTLHELISIILQLTNQIK